MTIDRLLTQELFHECYLRSVDSVAQENLNERYKIYENEKDRF